MTRLVAMILLCLLLAACDECHGSVIEPGSFWSGHCAPGANPSVESVGGRTFVICRCTESKPSGVGGLSMAIDITIGDAGTDGGS